MSLPDELNVYEFSCFIVKYNAIFQISICLIPNIDYTFSITNHYNIEIQLTSAAESTA